MFWNHEIDVQINHIVLRVGVLTEVVKHIYDNIKPSGVGGGVHTHTHHSDIHISQYDIVSKKFFFKY